MLLRHPGETAAKKVENAIIARIKKGQVTRDLGGNLDTEDFTRAVTKKNGVIASGNRKRKQSFAYGEILHYLTICVILAGIMCEEVVKCCRVKRLF